MRDGPGNAPDVRRTPRAGSLARGAVVAFLAAGAVVSGLSAVTLLVPGTPLDAMWAAKPDDRAALAQHGALAGWGFALLAVVLGVTAWGWWRRRPWARQVAVAVVAANLAGDVLRTLGAPHLVDVAPLLVAGAFLAWLAGPARRLFPRPLRSPLRSSDRSRPDGERETPVKHTRRDGETTHR